MYILKKPDREFAESELQFCLLEANTLCCGATRCRRAPDPRSFSAQRRSATVSRLSEHRPIKVRKSAHLPALLVCRRPIVSVGNYKFNVLYYDDEKYE